MWRSAPGLQEIQAVSAALVNRCEALIELGDLGRALEACLDAAKMGNVDRNAFYNLAGVYALSGRSDDAVAALEKDFEHGDRDHAYLAADPWFTALRGDPRFRSLLDRMKR